MKLYHRDIYFPNSVKSIPKSQIKIDTISGHAYAEFVKEKLKYEIDFLIPKIVDIDVNNFVEVEIEDNFITKLVLRESLNDELDLVLVICRNPTRGVLLRTLWINKKEDTHKTLDKSKYETQ